MNWLKRLLSRTLDRHVGPVRPANSCPYCGAELAFYRVIGRSHKGRVASAEKGWRCGTHARMELFMEVEFVRGEQCRPNKSMSGHHGPDKETT